jgi:hypothetical protein
MVTSGDTETGDEVVDNTAVQVSNIIRGEWKKITHLQSAVFQLKEVVNIP